jgi:NADH:ubiquinone oxidoreductase subunit 3 (subunit A)
MKALLTTLLYGAAGIAVGLGGYLLQRLLAPKAHPSSPDAHTPYECGEVPIGSAWQSWRWPFLPLATLLLLLEAEILFALPWVWVQKTLSPPMALIELLILVGPVGAAYAYLLWKGYLFPTSQKPPSSHLLPENYRHLQSYLVEHYNRIPAQNQKKALPLSREN